jgi:hypothetical protein
MIELIEEQLVWQQRLEDYRRRSIWVLRPGAWKARMARDANGREIRQLKEAGAARLLVAELGR